MKRQGRRLKMGRPCSICNDPDRLKVDRMIVAGQSFELISREFRGRAANTPAFSADAIARHAKNHLSQQLIRATDVKQRLTSDGLLEKIESLVVRAERIMSESEQSKTPLVELAAMKQCQSSIAYLSDLACKLKELSIQEKRVDAMRPSTIENLDLARLDDTELAYLCMIMQKATGTREGKPRQLVPPGWTPADPLSPFGILGGDDGGDYAATGGGTLLSAGPISSISRDADPDDLDLDGLDLED
jgi:hypothetical protein